MKTEDEIKALFGDWQVKAAAIPTLPSSILIGCIANGEHLIVMLGFQELVVSEDVAKLIGPEQATFMKHLQQIMEYTLERVRDEIDNRFPVKS